MERIRFIVKKNLPSMFNTNREGKFNRKVEFILHIDKCAIAHVVHLFSTSCQYSVSSAPGSNKSI